jgi:hypothetical protein
MPRVEANLAPYSFFGGFSDNPKVIAFSSDGYKDSVRNIEETGDFTWNLTSKNLAQAMNLSSAPVAPEVNEFELAGLTRSARKNGEVAARRRITRLIRMQVTNCSKYCGSMTLKASLSPTGLPLVRLSAFTFAKNFRNKVDSDLEAARPILARGLQGRLL